MAARSTNTVAEGVQRLLADIAQLKALPDADPESLTLCINLENQILAFIHKPIDQAQAQGAFGPGTAGTMGTPSGQGSGGIPGVAMQAGPPNPDELRRVLAGPQ